MTRTETKLAERGVRPQYWGADRYNSRPAGQGINADGVQISTIEADMKVDRRDRRTRNKRWEELDEDLIYTAARLDRDAMAEDQTRTVNSLSSCSCNLATLPEQLPPVIMSVVHDSSATVVHHVAAIDKTQ